MTPAGTSYSAQTADARLRAGRTCYRHLAGRVGVAVTDGLLNLGYITTQWELAPEGRSFLADLGAVVSTNGRRSIIRPCLDWTERREHIAGTAADALLRRCSSGTGW